MKTMMDRFYQSSSNSNSNSYDIRTRLRMIISRRVVVVVSKIYTNSSSLSHTASSLGATRGLTLLIRWLKCKIVGSLLMQSNFLNDKKINWRAISQNSVANSLIQLHLSILRISRSSLIQQMTVSCNIISLVYV